MTNRIEHPYADATQIIASLRANAPAMRCPMFTPNRNGYLSQTAPTYRFVDISDEIVAANKTKSDVSSDLAKTFRELADQWYKEILREPSLARMTSKISYLSILALEPKANVISLILNEIQSNHAPWFLALQILSKNREIGREHAGNFKMIADAWIRWGKQNRYI